MKKCYNLGMQKPRKKPRYSCFDYAIFLMGRKSYAYNEMATKLLTRGYEEEEVNGAVARLKELGYLDDALFAKSRVRSRADFSRWGKNKIRQELQKKGIASEHIDAALEFWEEGADELVEGEVSSNSWMDNAKELMMKKYGEWPSELPMQADSSLSWEDRQEHMKQVQKEKSRRINFLIRRGFSLEEAQAAFDACA